MYDASAEHSPQGGPSSSAPPPKRPRTEPSRRESVSSVYYVPDSDEEEVYSSDDIDNGAAEDDDDDNDALDDSELRIVRDTLYPSAAAAQPRRDETDERAPSQQQEQQPQPTEPAQPPAASGSTRRRGPSAAPLTEAELPAQPDPGTPASGRVQLRLPSGQRIVRRLMRSEPVRLLFAVASAHTGLLHSLAQQYRQSTAATAATAGSGAPAEDEFDLVMPSNTGMSLKDHPDDSVADMGLVGASIVVQPRLDDQ